MALLAEAAVLYDKNEVVVEEEEYVGSGCL
jgi:hypothetical protein